MLGPLLHPSIVQTKNAAMMYLDNMLHFSMKTEENRCFFPKFGNVVIKHEQPPLLTQS